MSTSSSSTTDRPQTLYIVIAVAVFALCVFVGLNFPVITIPWMVVLLIIGRAGMKSQKGSLAWTLSRGALAASIVLVVVVAVDLVRALLA